jgi:hypothetical protein
MNYWIVSAHEFMPHRSCESAMIEAQRLADKLGKPFHVYRVKNKLLPGPAESFIATPVNPCAVEQAKDGNP